MFSCAPGTLSTSLRDSGGSLVGRGAPESGAAASLPICEVVSPVVAVAVVVVTALIAVAAVAIVVVAVAAVAIVVVAVAAVAIVVVAVVAVAVVVSEGKIPVL